MSNFDTVSNDGISAKLPDEASAPPANNTVPFQESNSNRGSLNLDDFEKVETADRIPHFEHQTEVSSEMEEKKPQVGLPTPTGSDYEIMSNETSEPKLSPQKISFETDADFLSGEIPSFKATTDFESSHSDILNKNENFGFENPDNLTSSVDAFKTSNESSPTKKVAFLEETSPVYEPQSSFDRESSPVSRDSRSPSPTDVLLDSTQDPIALSKEVLIPSAEQSPPAPRMPTPPRAASPPRARSPPRQLSPPPQTTASLQDPQSFYERESSPVHRDSRSPSPMDVLKTSSKAPTPPREKSPPPREASPPPREESPLPREESPLPREESPLPREESPLPPKMTPPPPAMASPLQDSESDRDSRSPSPADNLLDSPRDFNQSYNQVPTLLREDSPPPRMITPPREESPPPEMEPSPPPKMETSPPPKMEPSAPSQKYVEVSSSPAYKVQDPQISRSKPSYKIPEASESLKKSLAVLKPCAWFNPNQLDPRVANLIYWRDVKKSGIVFGSLLMILLSLAYISLISVVAYSSLLLLSGTIAFRIYKNILQAIQKSQDGHPFKEYLELDTALPPEKMHEAADVFVSQLNSAVNELKRLFLVDDLIDSVKFGCLLWCLTYVGSWFNGLTLVILGVISLFSLPKVYEQNQAQIDQYVGLVRTQINDVTTKVRAAIPMGNKEKAQ